MNVEVEIYMSNIQKFFKNNPKDLLNLIPSGAEEEFFIKVRKIASENLENGNDVTLTKKQLLEVCVEINKSITQPKPENQIVGIFQNTKFGQICLN